MQNGTLGGLYTTVEGLFNAIHKNLEQAAAYVLNGDSTTDAQRAAWEALLHKLRFASTSDEEVADFTNWHSVVDCYHVYFQLTSDSLKYPTAQFQFESRH